jgi:hypothetical protein
MKMKKKITIIYISIIYTKHVKKGDIINGNIHVRTNKKGDI